MWPRNILSYTCGLHCCTVHTQIAFKSEGGGRGQRQDETPGPRQSGAAAAPGPGARQARAVPGARQACAAPSAAGYTRTPATTAATVTGLPISVKYGQRTAPTVAERSTVVELMGARARGGCWVLRAGYRAEAGGAEQKLQPTGNPHLLRRRRRLCLSSPPPTASQLSHSSQSSRTI